MRIQRSSAFFRKLLATGTAVALALLLSPVSVLAQIKNPVLKNDLGGDDAMARSGITTGTYLVSLWRATISLGALIVLLYFIWGAIEWITAGGDSAKVNKGRDRIVQSIIGFILLVSSAVIIGFIGRLFFGDSFNILQPMVPNNLPTGTP